MELHPQIIPPDLREAFYKAAEALESWRSGPVPLVTLDRKPAAIDGVFRLAALLDGFSPQETLIALMLAHDFRQGEEAVGHKCEDPKDDSTARVAACLLDLFQARYQLFRRKGLLPSAGTKSSP
jgi:hypothetical protein